MVKKLFKCTRKRKKLVTRAANSVLAACVFAGLHLYFFEHCHVCGIVIGIIGFAAKFVSTYFAEKEPDGNV